MKHRANDSAKIPKIFANIMLFLTGLVVASCTAISSDVSPSRSADQSITKKIAFSFDDSPRHKGAFLSRQDRSDMIIAALRNGGVGQAVFFINPANITDDNRATIDAYVDAGHVLANHTADHLKLSDVSAQEFLANVDAAQTWLQSHSASRPWMRFPYLDEGGNDRIKRDAIRSGLKKRNLRNGYVTADASDWYIDALASEAAAAGKNIDMKNLGDLFVDSHVLSANFAHDLALRTIGRAPVHVMLLHEADVTALYLADLIRVLKSDNWQIVSADEAYADQLGKLMSRDAHASGTILGMLATEKQIVPQWFERNNETVTKILFNKRVLHEEKQ